MNLIIGGAYQGKLAFAKKQYNLADDDVYTCGNENIDFSKRCIDHIERFTETHTDVIDYFRENRSLWENSVLICDDLFCGVVPMHADDRDWRQETGKLCQYLAGEADTVSRIFCGLEMRLK